MQRSLLVLLISAFILSVAKAHVGVNPKTAVAGDYAKLTFMVPHGCDGSPTTKITISIPEGVMAVKPQVNPGWKIAIKKIKLAKPLMSHGKEITEGVSEVSWTGGPLSDEHFDEFGISVKLPDSEGELLFPVTQKCKKGESEWKDKPGSEHVKHGHSLPAPVLKLTK